MRLDNETLTELENISKKLASPEEPLFTEKEWRVVKKIRQRNGAHSHTIQQILEEKFLFNKQPTKKII